MVAIGFTSDNTRQIFLRIYLNENSTLIVIGLATPLMTCATYLLIMHTSTPYSPLLPPTTHHTVSSPPHGPTVTCHLEAAVTQDTQAGGPTCCSVCVHSVHQEPVLPAGLQLQHLARSHLPAGGVCRP